MAQLRSVSSGTDVLSISAKSTRATLPHAAAPPSYVSALEAENLVYAELERQVRISSGALLLLNGFLDQLLYDILSKSQSINLTAIRAAVPLVLKQRLGRAAVKAGDEELQDYLEEDELEEIQNTPAVLDPRAEFDLDLAWKLTRLRCMVYAKLGDMEEEDEEDYLEGDDVRDHVNQLREANKALDRILPPAAIFLTTVLEFIAEQALCIAAQHARKRDAYLKDAARDTAPSEPFQDTISLEEIDMSGIGKEGPLIRLWRSWKGSVRAGGGAFSRPTTPSLVSPISPDSPTQEWRFPSAPTIPPIKEESRSATPANIPLPMTDDDARGIEVPGIAGSKQTRGRDQRPTVGKRNSTSMLVMPGQFPDLKPSNDATERPTASRRRSRSVPTSPVLLPSSTYLEPRRQAAAPGDQPAPTSIDGGQGDRPGSYTEQDGSALRNTTIGATVATIAGALSVEAAKASRREDPADSAYRAAPESAVESHSSISTANDFERMHIPLRAPTGVIDAAEGATLVGAADTEETSLNSSDADETEIDDEHGHPRDSGFGVAGLQDEPSQQEHGAVANSHHPQDHQSIDEPEQQHELVAPSTRSSNVGYATIFQTPNTSTGYSSSNSARTSGPGMARPEEPPAATKSSIMDAQPVVSASPAVILNRGPSTEHRNADYTDSRFPHQLPSSQSREQSEQPVPRFATSANARSRSASASQARPSTSGSATARRQHMRLRSDDPETRPNEDLDRTKKSLDLLIDSDETLHYTLTPPSATVGKKPKAKSRTQDLADFFKETAPPGQEARPKSSRSAKDGLNGLRANPPTPVTAKAPPAQPPVASPSRAKNLVGEPRDARMVRNNTRDLADYARSTGPENAAQLPKSLGPRPSTAQGPKSDLSLREKALSDDTRPNTAKSANRLKYQARDAKVPRTADSSDLIDFIREGPPRAPGEHRIDRHVAPFRTTMDSDDFNALAPPPDLDAKPRSSEASFPESAITTKSMPSSMNSRTGLLDSTNRAASKVMNGANVVSKQPVIPEGENGMPQRTRRRVRDPYAIDFSDEEDEVEQFEAPPKRRTDEESLVDFLRNTAPPPGMTAQSILAAVPGPTQPDASNMLKRSASGSRLKDFLPGGSSANKNNNSGDSGDATSNGATPTARTINVARASSPHLTQAGSKLDKYKPTTPTHAPHVDRNRTQNKTRVEPRGGTINSNSGGTADLAAFLKDSGPPPGMNDKPVQKFNTSVQKDQAGFLKFFQRKGSIRK